MQPKHRDRSRRAQRALFSVAVVAWGASCKDCCPPDPPQICPTGRSLCSVMTDLHTSEVEVYVSAQATVALYTIKADVRYVISTWNISGADFSKPPSPPLVYPPAGDQGGGQAGTGWPAPQCPKFSLLKRQVDVQTNTAHPWHCVTVPEEVVNDFGAVNPWTGRLELGVNDTKLDDNVGVWKVKVIEQRKGVTCCASGITESETDPCQLRTDCASCVASACGWCSMKMRCYAGTGDDTSDDVCPGQWTTSCPTPVTPQTCSSHADCTTTTGFCDLFTSGSDRVCIADPGGAVVAGGFCGDAVRNNGEDCDPPGSRGGPGYVCGAGCKWISHACGDGKIEPQPPEACDPGSPTSNNCPAGQQCFRCECR